MPSALARGSGLATRHRPGITIRGACEKIALLRVSSGPDTRWEKLDIWHRLPTMRMIPRNEKDRHKAVETRQLFAGVERDAGPERTTDDVLTARQTLRVRALAIPAGLARPQHQG